MAVGPGWLSRGLERKKAVVVVAQLAKIDEACQSNSCPPAPDRRLVAIAAVRAAAAALRAAHLALRLIRKLTVLASASAWTSALVAATTAHLAAITAASQAKNASALSVLARALRRRSAPLLFALPRRRALPAVSCAPTANDPKEQASREVSRSAFISEETVVLTLLASSKSSSSLEWSSS